MDEQDGRDDDMLDMEGLRWQRELKIEQPFNLGLSLMMGQAFRWQERPDGWFPA